jgi:hypothetical protein
MDLSEIKLLNMHVGANCIQQDCLQPPAFFVLLNGTDKIKKC